MTDTYVQNDYVQAFSTWLYISTHRQQKTSWAPASESYIVTRGVRIAIKLIYQENVTFPFNHIIIIRVHAKMNTLNSFV